MITNTIANAFLNNIAGRTVGTPAAAGVTYIGLSSTKPSEDGLNITEPDIDSGITRVLIGHNAQSLTQVMAAAANGRTTNTAQISFNKSKTNAGTYNYAVLFATASGGTAANVIGAGKLTTPLVIESGKVPIISPGDFTMSMGRWEDEEV